MVKGVSRRVVVVRPESNQIFEEAIFIVRGDETQKHDILKEACTVAERYLRNTVRRMPRRRYTGAQLVCAGSAGMGLMGCLWMLTSLLL